LIAAMEIPAGMVFHLGVEGSEVVGQVTLTVEDIERGLRALRAQRTDLRMSLGLTAALLIVFGYGMWRTKDLVWLALCGFIAAFTLLPMLRSILFLRSAASRRFRAMGSEERQLVVRFHADGVTIRAGSSEMSWQYAGVTRVVEAAECFVVYPRASIAQVVPKRAFAEHDIGRLRELISERVRPQPRVAFPWRRVAVVVALCYAAFLLAAFGLWWILGQW
jgi:YcxB-like protein